MPRSDTRRRVAIETYLILQRYRRFPPALLGEIFAPEIEAHPEWASFSPERLLAEAARLLKRPSHDLFAFDLLLDDTAHTGDYRSLYEVTGAINPFGVGLRGARDQLKADLDAARADNERLSAGLAEVGRGLDALAATSGPRRLLGAFGGLQASGERLRSVVGEALKPRTAPSK